MVKPIYWVSSEKFEFGTYAETYAFAYQIYLKLVAAGATDAKIKKEI